MQKNYLKYLTVPTLTCIFYTILFLAYFLCYQMNLYMADNPSDRVIHAIILNAIVSLLFLLPVIFVPTLIFTIAYKLTQLTLKNIVYTFLIALAIFLTKIASDFLVSFVQQIIYKSEDFYPHIYLAIFFSYYSILYPLIVTLIIMGVSTLYMKLNKYAITPTTNQHICLLYACLFITLTFIKQLGIPVINGISAKTNLPLFLYMFIAGIVIAAIYFIYYYAWTKEALHTNKITTNYPVKAISSCLLSILLLLTIIFILHMCILKLPNNMMRSFSDPKLILNVFITISYLLAMFMFFIIRYCSQSPFYRFAHIAYYLLVAIALMITLNLVTPSSYAHAEKIITIFGYIYGPLMFGISLSLCLLYLLNKISINLFFKNKQPAN